MNSLKLRIWVLLLMLVCCSVVYTSAASNLPVAHAAAPDLSWLL